MNSLLRISLVVTLFLIGFFGGAVFVRYEEFSTLRLNELGDFFAGTAGPVALIWLVLGYFQQRNSIQLQTSELKAAVEQYEEQARATQAIALNDLRSARIDFYKIVSETSALVRECEIKLGLEVGLYADLISQLSMSSLASASSRFFSHQSEISKEDLERKCRQLRRRQESLENNSKVAFGESFQWTEEKILEAVLHQSALRQLSFEIDNYNSNSRSEPIAAK